MNIIQRSALLLSVFLMAAVSFAQTAATAELLGTVKDPNGAVIQGASVALHDDARNIGRTAITNASGEYVLLSVPPGSYTLNVSAKGFAKLVARNVGLTVGQ